MPRARRLAFRLVLDADSATPHPFTAGAHGRAAFLPGSSTVGYTLCGDGALTPSGGRRRRLRPDAQWPNSDIARGLVLNPAGTGGYVLDGYGGIHPFAIRSNLASAGISPGARYGGSGVMDGLALGADGKTAAVVDSHDGVHLS